MPEIDNPFAEITERFKNLANEVVAESRAHTRLHRAAVNAIRLLDPYTLPDVMKARKLLMNALKEPG